MSDERHDLEKINSMDDAPLVRSGYPRGYPDVSSYGYGYGPEEDSKINFRSIWRTVRKHKLLILIITFIATSVATIEIYRSKSMYQAAASIEIRKSNTTIIKTADMVVQTDDFDTINTYSYILKSKPLLQDVAVSLHLDENPNFLDVTSRKSFWEGVKTVANRITHSTPAFVPPPVPLTPVAIKDDSLRTPEERARLAPYVGVLAGNLNVEQLPATRVLIISFTHTDPNIAAAVANAAAQAFVQRAYLAKTEKFTKASDWLDDATRKLKAQMQEAEQRLADYTRQNNVIIQADNKDALSTEKYLRLHEQVMRAETDRVLKQSLLAQVQAGKVAELPEAFTNADTKEAQKNLAELRVELAKANDRYGPENPRIRDLQLQIAALERQVSASTTTLEERIKADYERAVRDEQSLKVLLEKAKAEAAQQNQAVIQYNILKQDVDTSKTLYTEFLNKTNQANLQVQEQDNNVRLAEPADVPGAPIGPNRLRAILMTLLLSLAAGVGLAFFLEYLDNTIKTVEDVNRYARLPALSVIPAIGGATSLGLASKRRRKALAAGNAVATAPGSQLKVSDTIMYDTRSSAAEAYRVLRTSVLLSAAGQPPKTMLVTSGQPGEGKTTTAINTAISLAQLGASVVIVDADLRRPSTHKVFGVEHVRGLSTFLSRDIDVAPLIHKLPIPNLSLLPCGPVPPNPAELISSDRMKEMIRTLSERYDHIIIDSPPLMNVTDPVILSTLVDGVILVVHGGKSTRNVVSRTRQELVSVGAKIFGVVLNNVDLKREGYDDYYYYRYYTDYNQQGDSAESV